MNYILAFSSYRGGVSGLSFLNMFVLIRKEKMDKKGHITYKIIEPMIDKSIRYIKENGDRGVRNIVDMGAHFATGRFQKGFFDNVQQILDDENSSYYTFAQNLVNSVDHQIIKRFGINLGYSSWTYGAKKIRENEKEHGYNIPWTIVFDFNQAATPRLSGKDVSGILNSGEMIGIYCAMFFIEDASVLKEILPILSAHKESAFFIYVQPDIITDSHIDEILEAQNIAVVLAMNPTEKNSLSDQVAEKLFDKKCFYGIYSEYSDDNIDYIMSDTYVKRLQKTRCTFSLLVGKQLNEDSNQRFIQFMECVKKEICSLFFLVDFYDDFAYIDRIISVEDCFMAIKGNGQIAVSAMDNVLDLNIKELSLNEILKRTMPKTHYVI